MERNKMNILLVVDMLNGFCRKGFPLSLDQSTLSIERYIAKRIHATLRNGNKVIFACDAHNASNPEFAQYPPHCLKGTNEAMIVESLIKYLPKAKIIYKTRFSPFFGTKLHNLLVHLHPKHVEVVGVCTDICVLYTVEELRNRGYQVTVPEKGVLATKVKFQKIFLEHMQNTLGANVIWKQNRKKNLIS